MVSYQTFYYLPQSKKYCVFCHSDSWFTANLKFISDACDHPWSCVKPLLFSCYVLFFLCCGKVLWHTPHISGWRSVKHHACSSRIVILARYPTEQLCNQGGLPSLSIWTRVTPHNLSPPLLLTFPSSPSYSLLCSHIQLSCKCLQLCPSPLKAHFFMHAPSFPLPYLFFCESCNFLSARVCIKSLHQRRLIWEGCKILVGNY